MILQFSNDVAKTLSIIHDKYAIIPADKAQNNIIFVYKTYYIQYLLSEVDVENNKSDETYTATLHPPKKR